MIFSNLAGFGISPLKSFLSEDAAAFDKEFKEKSRNFGRYNEIPGDVLKSILSILLNIETFCIRVLPVRRYLLFTGVNLLLSKIGFLFL